MQSLILRLRAKEYPLFVCHSNRLKFQEVLFFWYVSFEFRTDSFAVLYFSNDIVFMKYKGLIRIGEKLNL
jgi:hypothetical protein